MKKAPHVIKMFRMDPTVAETLESHAAKTNKSQLLIVERAIIRYCKVKP